MLWGSIGFLADQTFVVGKGEVELKKRRIEGSSSKIEDVNIAFAGDLIVETISQRW